MLELLDLPGLFALPCLLNLFDILDLLDLLFITDLCFLLDFASDYSLADKHFHAVNRCVVIKGEGVNGMLPFIAVIGEFLRIGNVRHHAIHL